MAANTAHHDVHGISCLFCGKLSAIPSEGRSYWGLRSDSPSTVFLVRCPHCQKEAPYAPFHPQAGETHEVRK